MRRSNVSQENTNNSLSVVIIARNEANNIARTIESVLHMTKNWPQIEILLVDSASTDETVEIAKHYPINIVSLKSSWFLSAAAGRYIGTLYTHGDFILFLDGDMELGTEWLHHAIRYAQEHPRAAIIGGYRRDVYTSHGKIIDEVDIKRDPHDRVLEAKFISGAMLCKRYPLVQVGGYNPFIKSEEEIDLSMRMRYAGYKLIILPYLICRHYCIPMGSWHGTIRRIKLGLWLGYGQVPRYHLGTPFFWIYLTEQSQFAFHFAGIIVSLVLLLLTLFSGNMIFFACWLFVVMAGIVAFAIKKRNLSEALLSFMIHIMIIYFSVRGFLMAPRSQSEYPINVEIVCLDFPGLV